MESRLSFGRHFWSLHVGLLLLGCEWPALGSGEDDTSRDPGGAGGTVPLGGDPLAGLGADGAGAAGGFVTDYDGDPNAPAPFEGTASGLAFSVTRGVYSAPFDLTISHPIATELRYTLDCSDPRSSSTALTATLPHTLRVDPADTNGRFLAPGFVVRATADGPTAAPVQVTTHSYLFLDRVVELSPDGSAPGPQWPAPVASSVGGWSPGGFGDEPQMIDYGMDPDVTGSPDYSGQMLAALTSIPSVSLVTELSNLFDPTSGIYVNAQQEGAEWERFGSFELLFPDNRPGCQGNAGIRIRGGYSRLGTNPKHAFRLFFSGDYGTPKLRFPLFGSEGEASFDKLDLRTSQNYSWAFEGGDSGENIMVRDVFSRDLQRLLGRPYTRSRAYHLFLDGVYWGLYQSEERPEAAFASSYLGGARADWDTVKSEKDGDTAYMTVTDGTMDSWQAVWDLVQAGFPDDNLNYYRLEGKATDGVRDPSLPVLVDVDNLIDYLLVTFYTGNFDGPVSKFYENKVPNNTILLDNRADLEHGFVFIAHDNEHTLLADPIRAGDGVVENRANIGYPGCATDENHRVNDAYQMSVTNLEAFQPQWLHHQLVQNAQYRLRFQARAQAVLGPGGAMTPEVAIPLLQARADEIDPAIVAESARWGDAKRANEPRTRNDDWAPALERAKSAFLGVRTPIVIEQLRTIGIHP